MANQEEPLNILEAMLEKQHNALMNKRLNLLTIWSTIFLTVIIISYVIQQL